MSDTAQIQERPILFSAPMVRAILEGRKTQTRRIMKAPPIAVKPHASDVNLYMDNGQPITEWYWFDLKTSALLEIIRPRRREKPTKAKLQRAEQFLSAHHPAGGWWAIDEVAAMCPYGQPGDRLWVRETWKPHPDPVNNSPIIYKATDGGCWPDLPWRPSIHMPRWASRITLEIADIRVERLHDISVADCIAEGAAGGHGAIPGYAYATTPLEHYRHIWGSINGPGSWAVNPWVWVLEFKMIDK
jgi:hypothetical protein